MKYIIFLIAFFGTFSIVNSQSEVEQIEAQIKNTADVQQITDIINKNNKLVEDNIKKFDESTRKKVTNVLLKAANVTTSTTPKTSTNSTKNDQPETSNSDKNTDMSFFLLLVYLFHLYYI
jgi:hypothetical protein